MLTLGFLWLLQVVLVPGWAAIRLFRLPVAGFVHHALASFALSLIANAAIAFLAWFLGIYNRPFAFIWVAACHAALAWSLARDRFRIPLRWEPVRFTIPGILAALAVGVAVADGANIAAGNFGSVFTMIDDVVSWDRWAMEWAENRQRGSGLYPQLLPLNWSLCYLLLGTTGIKLFAKAIMPLFFLGAIAAPADLFRKTGDRFWLAAPVVHALIVHHLFTRGMIVSGYADLASAFFVAMALHAMVWALRTAPENSAKATLLVFVFATGGLLTKQGTVWFWLIASVWTAIRLVRLRRESGTRPLRWLATSAVVLNCWYFWMLWRQWTGAEGTNLGFLTGQIHRGMGPHERWASSFHLLTHVRGEEIAPLIYVIFGLILIAVFHRTGRWVLAALLPFYCLWALGFSYEARTVAAALPLASVCAAAGLAVLFGGRWWMRIASAGAIAAGLHAGVMATTGSWRHSLHFLPLTEWWKEMSPLGISAARVALGGAAAWMAARRFRASFLIPVAPVALALAIAVLAVQRFAWPDKRLLADQLEKRKAIGSPAVNKCLYELYRANRFQGKIATDYFHLEFLPDLGRFAANRAFASVTAESLDRIRAEEPEVQFVLTNDFKFAKDVAAGKRRESAYVVCEEKGYVMVELPR